MIKAKVVADSLSPQGDRLISLLVDFPRIILAEVNTHRMLSKNTSSSRAIPFKKMVEAVKNNPFIPIAWQKDHKGMQGSEYFTDEKEIELNERAWLEARDNAIGNAKFLTQGGITKQLANRLLEPFMWTTMLITGTYEGGWDNFFNLRCPQYVWKAPIREINGLSDVAFKSKKDYIDYNNLVASQNGGDNCFNQPDINDTLGWLQLNKGLAEIHMMALAECIYDAVLESKPKQLQAGGWHIPFGDNINVSGFVNDNIHTLPKKVVGQGLLKTIEEYTIKVSTAMGARTSYTIVGEEKEISYSKLIELDDKLLKQWPPHSSPMEHCAKCMDAQERELFVKGNLEWTGGQYDKPLPVDGAEGWCRNFRGFIQRRYLIETSN